MWTFYKTVGLDSSKKKKKAILLKGKRWGIINCSILKETTGMKTLHAGLRKSNSKKSSWSNPTSLIRGAHLSRHCGISVSFLGGEDGAVDM